MNSHQCRILEWSNEILMRLGLSFSFACRRWICKVGGRRRTFLGFGRIQPTRFRDVRDHRRCLMLGRQAIAASIVRGWIGLYLDTPRAGGVVTPDGL